LPVFEHRSQPLLPRKEFVFRILRFTSYAISLITVSLLVGIFGYMGFAHLNMVDAFLNAAMIMGGMGPVNVLSSNAAKIFAGIYALYCGMILLISVGIMAAPVLHRLLHILHLQPTK
jgi:hypothetical protein